MGAEGQGVQVQSRRRRVMCSPSQGRSRSKRGWAHCGALTLHCNDRTCYKNQRTRRAAHTADTRAKAVTNNQDLRQYTQQSIAATINDALRLHKSTPLRRRERRSMSTEPSKREGEKKHGGLHTSYISPSLQGHSSPSPGTRSPDRPPSHTSSTESCDGEGCTIPHAGSPPETCAAIGWRVKVARAHPGTVVGTGTARRTRR